MRRNPSATPCPSRYGQVKIMHWKEVDFRIESLELTLNALHNSIIEYRTNLIDITSTIEVIEPIIGVSFVCLQNYINGSIYDRYETNENQSVFYKRNLFLKRQIGLK
ncbi:hypothetical protein BC781_1155 [Sediminitomix flava]|uniref:Uncharacterized protein n=1 Tax=Sediminitomix flava TaxID=379075 RepID=A0A315YUS2_SEDFL|nr:hypothetical protein BC781_1155 [Sediminitomix flava]